MLKLLLILLLVPSIVYSATITVNSGGTYPTLYAGLQAAGDGDTVSLETDTTETGTNIPTTLYAVIIKSSEAGVKRTVTAGASTVTKLLSTAYDVTVQDIKFVATNATTGIGAYIDSGSRNVTASFNRCEFTNFGLRGIEYLGANKVTLTVDRCKISATCTATAVNAWAGGIVGYAAANTTSTSTLNVSNSVILIDGYVQSDGLVKNVKGIGTRGGSIVVEKSYIICTNAYGGAVGGTDTNGKSQVIRWNYINCSSLTCNYTVYAACPCVGGGSTTPSGETYKFYGNIIISSLPAFSPAGMTFAAPIGNCTTYYINNTAYNNGCFSVGGDTANVHGYNNLIMYQQETAFHDFGKDTLRLKYNAFYGNSLDGTTTVDNCYVECGLFHDITTPCDVNHNRRVVDDPTNSLDNINPNLNALSGLDGFKLTSTTPTKIKWQGGNVTTIDANFDYVLSPDTVWSDDPLVLNVVLIKGSVYGYPMGAYGYKDVSAKSPSVKCR